MVKFCQSWVTWGNATIDFDVSVVLCSLVSVCSRVTSASTVTDSAEEPTFNSPFTVMNPTCTVTGPRTSFWKPSLLNVTVYSPVTMESVS